MKEILSLQQITTLADASGAMIGITDAFFHATAREAKADKELNGIVCAKLRALLDRPTKANGRRVLIELMRLCIEKLETKEAEAAK